MATIGGTSKHPEFLLGIACVEGIFFAAVVAMAITGHSWFLPRVDGTHIHFWSLVWVYSLVFGLGWIHEWIQGLLTKEARPGMAWWAIAIDIVTSIAPIVSLVVSAGYMILRQHGLYNPSWEVLVVAIVFVVVRSTAKDLKNLRKIVR